MNLPLRLSACALVLLTGCDLIKKATNTTIAAGLIIATPEVKLNDQFDVKSQVLATMYVGERESATSTEEPTPIVGADTDVQFAGNTVVLAEQSEPRGFYEADSVQNPALIYSDSQIYIFNAVPPGESIGFGGTVTAPQRLSPATLSFTPQPGNIDMVQDVKSHPKNTALTVAWSPANGRYAYVTVIRARAMDPTNPMVVFDTQPKSGGEILKFVLGTPPTSITIPASTFAQDGAYAVIVVTMDRGDTKSNTFLGSPILAGSGAALVLAVGDFRP